MDGRLRATGNLDFAPGEVHAAAERLADRLFPGEPSRVVLRGVGTGITVDALRLGEDTLPEPRSRQSPLDAADLDQIDSGSHCTISIVPESIQVTPKLAIPLTEIELRFSRSSGPGGQHAQKTETRVEAVFDVASSTALTDAQRRRLLARVGPVVRAVAQDERSQWRNREVALERLAEAIRAGIRIQRKRRPTAPTAAARERRLEEKRRRSKTKRLRQEPED
jgi:ribosome-associated protein